MNTSALWLVLGRPGVVDDGPTDPHAGPPSWWWLAVPVALIATVIWSLA